MDSRQFPSLESIAFRHFPEWDIFFIMLERRNLHHSGKVSPIEKIQLPSYYPRFLFTPMHDLICGKFPIRPSNYDLSVAGNTDVLGDKSISGCILCLRSLLACDEPPFPKLAFTSTASPATEISIYPTTDDEVLSTWEYRTKVWNDKWYKIMRTTRELECDLYYRYDLIQTITKDSCKGVC
ncbi:hypothetical protein CPB86DRAFT_693954 [Serendipita vermifera]|nr:hypothetical protein CPB86DRAFT_693954 [Serendipita vermifera]